MAPPKWEDSSQFKALGAFASRPGSTKYKYAYATWKALNFPKPKEKEKHSTYKPPLPTYSASGQYHAGGHSFHGYR